jgi:hypothetical protein
MFLDHFNVLMSKINLNKKNIILIYFKIKNILKSNHFHNIKYYFNLKFWLNKILSQKFLNLI